MKTPATARTPLCEEAVAARGGDRAALARLLRGVQDVVWRYCLSQLGNHTDAEDATQETAARVIASIAKFQGRSTAKTWVLGIALNVCRERRRRRVHADEGLESAADALPAPGDRVADAETNHQLRRVLKELPSRQSEAIVLRYFEQLSIQETAQVMGCREGTVKAAVWQALRSLRSRLERPQGTTCE